MNHSRRKTDALDLLGQEARVPAPAPTPVIGTLRVSQPAATLRLTSAQVFGGALEVQIDHHGVVYRLKQTALGKLILTK